jgi:hypothetical protein
MTPKNIEEFDSAQVERCLICEEVLLKDQQLACSGDCHTKLKESMLLITKALQVTSGFDTELAKDVQESIDYWEKW